jgi:hypothetical protein
MRTRSFLATGFVASTALVVAAALPAAADPGTDSTVTFTVVSGGLSISAPASADLGNVSVGGESVSAQLGSVTVNDLRGVLAGSWTATVSSTDFTTGGGTSGETVNKSNISYWSGPAQWTTGVGTFIPGQPTAGDAVTLDETHTAFSAINVSGANSAGWNPAVVVNLPMSAVAGVYAGTITHSAL